MLARIRDRLADFTDQFDRQWRKLSSRYGWRQPRRFAAYRGYANRQAVWVHGRLLANRVARPVSEDASWFVNLRATVGRIASREVPDARVELSYGAQSQQVQTDSEGYYTATFERDSLAGRRVFARTMTGQPAVLGCHEIHHVRQNARLMLISDIDDTVIHTGITDLLQAARLTFLSNSKTRKPLPGVAALYQQIARAGACADDQEKPNPVFYLSNSPWNLYDLLEGFLDHNEFPKGPLLLRDIGVRASSVSHKPHTLNALMTRFSDMKVILIGDSGERDALYYTELANDYAERICAIYIRDVDPGVDSVRDQRVDTLSQTSIKLGIPFLRVRDSVDIANSLRALEVLDVAAVQSIARATTSELDQ